MIYRLKRTVVTNDKDLAVGKLCFSPNHASNKPTETYVTSDPRGYGYSTKVGADDVERNPAIMAKDFDVYLRFIAAGRTVLPNVEPVEDVFQALSNLASAGSVGALGSVSHVRLPGDQHSRWARLFIDHTQMAGPSGKGVAILYRRSIWHQSTSDIPQHSTLEEVPAIVRFAICQHEVKEGSGADHQRGWHPAYCPKCGLNLSVDSSD